MHERIISRQERKRKWSECNFNENTSMNVMFIDDTIEDLNQGYGQLVTKSAENTTTHSTS